LDVKTKAGGGSRCRLPWRSDRVTGRRGRFDCGWNIEWFRRIQEVNRLRDQIMALLDTNLRLRLVNIDWGEVINHVVTENIVPLIGFEVGQGVNRGSDSCKPVIEHNAPLGGDAACVGRGAVKECLVEKPMLIKRSERGCHLGIFLPSTKESFRT
jgi:hypothetical protein